MNYTSETIANVIRRLNQNYFLPAIQRQFVWQPEQIIGLFDSIMRDYPIQSFLFWEPGSERQDQWDVYEFITHFSQRDPHNRPASTVGVQQLTLVLDGQQRLTALLIGLKGSYTVKKKWRRRRMEDAWSRMTLYLDLLKTDDRGETVGDSDIRYGFKFFEEPPINSNEQHWFKVSGILDCDSQQRFDELLEKEEELLDGSVTRTRLRVFDTNLRALYRTIWRDPAISYYREPSSDLDRVLDIFVRVNEGGTKLSRSDLLLSTVTAHWQTVNARDEIYGFVDRLNNELALKNNLGKDFILKACLVLTDLEVEYKVQNFSRGNLAKIESQWNSIKAAIECGVRLVNSFGIDGDSLTSANALIPIIYYLYRHPKVTLSGSSIFDAENRARVRQWLILVLLTGMFGRATDTVLEDARRVLRENESEQGFPLEPLAKAAFRRAGSGRDIVDLVLDQQYGPRTTVLALSLLYDDQIWGPQLPQQDHVFPQVLFTPKRLEEAGIIGDRVAEYLELKDRMGNLELLSPQENTEKSGKPFAEWLATRSDSFRARHHIPDDPELLAFSRFPDFVAAREDLIRERLSLTFEG
jgi:hypothetical protein